MGQIREAAVAGRFYPGDPGRLAAMMEQLVGTPTPQEALGAVVPHAGYVYSGAVAGATLAHVAIPATVVVLCPKHTHYGDETALMTRGAWEIPGGEIPIDEALADLLLEHLPGATDNARAHAREHSLEVILPFLHYLRPDLHFVPLALGYRPYEACRQLGVALGEVLQERMPRPLLVASSDMNHYQDHETTLTKDQLAIDRFLALDPSGLHEVCAQHDISMCGVIPATVMLVAAQILGATVAELLQHTTSGETSGDYQQVVGYAGMIVR